VRRSFETALAAVGTPLVGIIAEQLYGFPTNSPTYECRDGQPIDSNTSHVGKAEALGNALLVCMVVPWMLCLAIYSLLHWTYPQDRRPTSQLTLTSLPDSARNIELSELA
jgi:hypothetical protein